MLILLHFSFFYFGLYHVIVIDFGRHLIVNLYILLITTCIINTYGTIIYYLISNTINFDITKEDILYHNKLVAQQNI